MTSRIMYVGERLYNNLNKYKIMQEEKEELTAEKQAYRDAKARYEFEELVHNKFGYTKRARKLLGIKLTPIVKQKVQARNEKCSCGSGKKFKHCCI